MTAESEQPAVAVHRWIDECVNEQRTEVCYEIFDEQYVGHSPPHAEPEPLYGPEGYKAFIEGILRGFPGARDHRGHLRHG